MFAGIRKLVLIPFAFATLLSALDYVAEDTPARRQAYCTVSALAPWNLVTAYLQIVFIPDSASGGSPSLRSFDPFGKYCSAADNSVSDYYLTRGTNYFLRFVTALIDLLFHLFSDTGAIGFLFALAHLSLGALWTLYLGRKEAHGLYFYSIGLPLGTIVLGSVSAIPLWLIALICLTLFNAAVGIFVQGFCTVFAVTWAWVKNSLIPHTMRHDFVEVMSEEGEAPEKKEKRAG